MGKAVGEMVCFTTGHKVHASQYRYTLGTQTQAVKRSRPKKVEFFQKKKLKTQKKKLKIKKKKLKMRKKLKIAQKGGKKQRKLNFYHIFTTKYHIFAKIRLD